MARRKQKKRKKTTPYIITEYTINGEEWSGRIDPLPNRRIKVTGHPNPLKATATVRGGHRFFQDGDTVVRVPEMKWQELLSKTITVEAIWDK